MFIVFFLPLPNTATASQLWEVIKRCFALFVLINQFPFTNKKQKKRKLCVYGSALWWKQPPVWYLFWNISIFFFQAENRSILGVMMRADNSTIKMMYKILSDAMLLFYSESVERCINGKTEIKLQQLARRKLPQVCNFKLNYVTFYCSPSQTCWTD